VVVQFIQGPAKVCSYEKLVDCLLLTATTDIGSAAYMIAFGCQCTRLVYLVHVRVLTAAVVTLW